jgi:hypothetical protein
MDCRLQEYVVNEPRFVHKYLLFTSIKKKFIVVKVCRYVCLAFIYISIISVLAKDALFLGAIANRMLYLSGVVGMPVFATVLFILEKYSAVLLSDAQFISSEMIVLSRRK